MSQQPWGAPPSRPGPGQPPSWAPGPGTFAPPGFGQPFLGPAWGPPPVAGPYARPGVVARPPRRSPMGMVLLGLIALAVLAIAGFVVANSVSQPAEVAFQNDDYQVPPPDTNPPPVPIPDTYEEAQQTVLDSPFYAQTAPAPVRCTTLPINVDTATDAQLKSHFEGMIECLVRVWQPPITAAGLQIVRPSVTIYGEKMTTKCGTADINAFYCAADQQVYYSNRLAKAIPIVAKDKWAADVVIAHEFGHAVQGRSGILISAKALGQQSGDENADLLYTRRLETQADCFSGMFLRSVSRSLGIQQVDLAGIDSTYDAIGDDVLTGDPDVVGNHGHAATRRFWGDTGLGNGAVRACNTFKAPENQLR